MAAQYRNFASVPAWTKDGSRDPNNTDSWLEWMTEERLIHDFLPRPVGSCALCGQPMTSTYPQCYQCGQVRKSLDGFISTSYSLDSDLESLIRHYKDFGHSWPGAPLATLLAEAFERHGDCIFKRLGVDPILTWVPSNDPERSFDHIERLINMVDTVKTLPWRNDIVVRDSSVPRPGPRKEQTLVNPNAYVVLEDVRGESILLLDDLYTSGASMGSTAAALKAAGAAQVYGLVLGRQLRRNNNYGNSAQVFEEVEKRGWEFNDCAFCA